MGISGLWNRQWLMRWKSKVIPGAQFVPLDSKNHILLEDEPAWPKFVAALRNFLREDDE